jgi:hypothetical protein
MFAQHSESYAATMAMTALSETRAAGDWIADLAPTTKAQTVLNMVGCVALVELCAMCHDSYELCAAHCLNPFTLILALIVYFSFFLSPYPSTVQMSVHGIELSDGEMTAVRSLCDDDVDALYAYMMNIVSDVKNKTEAASDHRVAGLSLVREQIVLKAAASTSAGAEPVSLPLSFADGFLVASAPIAHVVVHSDTMCRVPSVSESRRWTSGTSPFLHRRRCCVRYTTYFRRCGCPVGVVSVWTCYPLRYSMCRFVRFYILISSNKRYTKSRFRTHAYAHAAGDECTVRLCVQGGDKMLHAFLCAFLSLRRLQPEFFAGIAMKIFLLPSAPNSVAAFIGRHDPWYRRHVLNPFRSPVFLSPWIRPEDDERFVEGNQSHDCCVDLLILPVFSLLSA